MDDLARNLARDPGLYPQKFDPGRDEVLIIPMAARDYRAAIFLDDRILKSGMSTAWISAQSIRDAFTESNNARPIHFLFHAGHAGSTLVSRLLDETGSVLNIREPLPLRTLAAVRDKLGHATSIYSAAQFEDRLDLFLRLWSRGFPDTQSVVVKATSSAGRLADVLLQARPLSRAVYLSLKPDVFLATMLSRSAAIADMRSFAEERVSRLFGLIGDFGRSLRAMSVGELAAATWLCERLTEQHAAVVLGDRLLRLDFDDVLRDVPTSLAAVLNHFSIAIAQDDIRRIAQSPVLTRYSKAPDGFAYTAQIRDEVLAQSRNDNRAEIARGRTFLEIVAARSPHAASALRGN